MTDSFGNLISMLDYVLCTRRRRHITGGVLLSVLLFGGLALTAITLRADMDKEEDDDE